MKKENITKEFTFLGLIFKASIFMDENMLNEPINNSSFIPDYEKLSKNKILRSLSLNVLNYNFAMIQVYEMWHCSDWDKTLEIERTVLTLQKKN